jgi:hypothetical protein
VIAGPGRTILRVGLPTNLLSDLEAEASRRDVSVQDVVDQVFVEQIPRLLAEAAAQKLRRSLQVSDDARTRTAVRPRPELDGASP